MRTKRWVAVLSCLMLAAGSVHAQRNLPGQIAVQVSSGFVDGLTLKTADGKSRFYGTFGLTRTNRNKSHWQFGLCYVQKDYLHREQVIPKAQFTAEAGIFFPVVTDRRQIVSFHIGATLLAGYETSNWGEKLLDDGSTLQNGDTMIWGAALVAELETYLTDRLILLGQVKQRGVLGTDFGHFHTLIGLGLRIVIN